MSEWTSNCDAPRGPCLLHKEHAEQLDAQQKAIHLRDRLIDKLKLIITTELTENDELGAEFVYVQSLKEEIKRLTAESAQLILKIEDFKERLKAYE